MNKVEVFIINCLILFSVLSVYMYIPNGKIFPSGPDEICHLRYAADISEKGLSQFKHLVNSYIADPEARKFPPPLRVGHILLTTLWFKFFGIGFAVLAKFSFFCYLLFILANFRFSRKFFSEDVAYPFTLLISSSPLLMAMAKRALTDSNASLFWALSIWAFMDFLKTKKKSKFFIFLGVYTVCISVKEFSAALLVFFAVFFLIHKYYFKNKVSDLYLLGFVCIPLVIVGISYAVLFGGGGNLLILIKTILHTQFGGKAVASEYAVLFCRGPWYRYIIDYLMLSPITTLLFMGYLGYIVVSRIWEWKIIYLLLYFVINFGMFATLEHSKVVRLVSGLEFVVYLFSVLILYELFRQNDKQKQARLVFISVLIIFLVNYLNFTYLFCQLDIYDPVTYWLLVAKKMIPYK